MFTFLLYFSRQMFVGYVICAADMWKVHDLGEVWVFSFVRRWLQGHSRNSRVVGKHGGTMSLKQVDTFYI